MDPGQVETMEKSEHEYTGERECSLGNSGYEWRDGYSFACCSCGWKSAPVKARDCVTVWAVHAQQTGSGAAHQRKTER